MVYVVRRCRCISVRIKVFVLGAVLGVFLTAYTTEIENGSPVKDVKEYFHQNTENPVSTSSELLLGPFETTSCACSNNVENGSLADKTNASIRQINVVAYSSSVTKKAQLPASVPVTSPHPVEKQSGVITPHPFQYTLTPGFCTPGKGSPHIIAYVHSAPRNVEKRAIIRETWANRTYHGNISLGVFFATGLSSTPRLQKTLEKESKLYGDILQEDYKDNYKNLTYKGVGSLRWILNNCYATTFILKTDDDVYVNVFALLKHLQDLHRTGQTSNILFCLLRPYTGVEREGKWGIPHDMYPWRSYPPHCLGMAFVLTMDVVRALYEASYHTPLFWIDDVWLTGMVAANANVRHIASDSSYLRNITSDELVGDHWYQYLFCHLGRGRVADVNLLRVLWKKVVMVAQSHTIPDTEVVVPGKVISNHTHILKRLQSRV